MEHLAALVRAVPDFPSPGILFRDITPLLAEPRAFGEVIEWFADRFRGERVEVVAGVESRGFIVGAPLAVALGAGFVPIRKVGKLPAATVRREYSLEYGSSELELHADAVRPGQRVLLIDDVLATGGTAAASAELVEELGGELVALAFLIELGFLGGREKLRTREVVTMLSY